MCAHQVHERRVIEPLAEILQMVHGGMAVAVQVVEPPPGSTICAAGSYEARKGRTRRARAGQTRWARSARTSIARRRTVLAHFAVSVWRAHQQGRRARHRRVGLHVPVLGSPRPAWTARRAQGRQGRVRRRCRPPRGGANTGPGVGGRVDARAEWAERVWLANLRLGRPSVVREALRKPRTARRRARARRG